MIDIPKKQPEFVNILKQVKAMLSIVNNGKNTYICNCIKQTNADPTAKTILIRVIRNKINNHYVFSDWLKTQIDPGLVNKDINENEGKKVQETRHAWVDYMIKEFS